MNKKYILMAFFLGSLFNLSLFSQQSQAQPIVGALSDGTFGSSGSGNGQFNHPKAAAVDSQDRNLFQFG